MLSLETLQHLQKDVLLLPHVVYFLLTCLFKVIKLAEDSCQGGKAGIDFVPWVVGRFAEARDRSVTRVVGNARHS